MARKKMDLKTFDAYQYLKELDSDNADLPFFLANDNTYKSAAIRFPVRAFSYGIGITYVGGNGVFKIGSTEYKMLTGSLITIGPGIVSQWIDEYNSEHDTIYFTEQLFENTLKSSFIRSLSFFLPGGNHVIVVDKDHREKARTLFETLKQFKNDPEIVPGIIYALLKLVIKCHGLPSPDRLATSSKEKVVGDFKALVAKHFLEQKDVSFYASSLNITPKYLSQVLLSETGKTAKTLILEHLLLEAKSLLRQTSMTVLEICNWLGYTDHSYFTKAFKKFEGCTPLEYRNL
jgi:AraC family transcriptional regulator, transcriptional activator of pobA